MIKHILLATDGSAAAERAADMAASLAMRYDAKLTVVHAYHPIPIFLGEPNYSQAVERALESGTKLVQGVANRLRELGVKEVIAELVEGAATDVILAMVETRNPDLVVVGSRGLGTWQGAFLGSVSMSVTQRAPCPVLVVK
ncbi:MAG: universal stress protein [Thermoflexales bacterium]|nr:universal stress protein [Thermoflexales bacterium]MDW8351232.1 universal stress protein [Anaerolineae bacterium]